MDTMSERFRELLRKLSITGRDFGAQAGLSEPDVSRIRNGKTGVSPEMRRKIKAAFPQINMDWLEVGEGKPFIEDQSSPEVHNIYRDKLICNLLPTIAERETNPEKAARQVIAYVDAIIKARDEETKPPKKLTLKAQSEHIRSLDR